MDLTSPLLAEDIQTAFPRDSRGMGAAEIEELLRVEEHALRTLYGVTRKDAEASEALRNAMIAAWPSFLQQVRQVASETAGAATYQVTYNRAGVIDFVFPSFVGTILSGVAEVGAAASAPSSTQLVR